MLDPYPTVLDTKLNNCYTSHEFNKIIFRPDSGHSTDLPFQKFQTYNWNKVFDGDQDLSIDRFMKVINDFYCKCSH